MDDREILRGATECAFDDPPMNEVASDDCTESTLSAEAVPVQPDDMKPRLVPAESAAAAERAADDEGMRVVEALLFSSDTPLSAARLAELAESLTPGAVRKHIAVLNEKYEAAGLTFRIEAIAKGYQMMTVAGFEPWIAKLNKQRSESRLSDAALETLSIVAYRQPVIRADVEAIRGVACGEVISRLRDMGLVRVLGRAEIVGRPLLYGTTRKFLDVFGLADLDDLPPMEALRVQPKSKAADEIEPVKPKPEPAAELAAVGT